MLELAERVAKRGEIVTLGIQPKNPATGYGYIEVDEDVVAEGASQVVNAGAGAGTYVEVPLSWDPLDLTAGEDSGAHYAHGRAVLRVLVPRG